MKTKEKENEKEFDTVIFFRTLKEKISKETLGISFEEFKIYLGKRKLKSSKS